ncbi:MAG: DUF1995 family protein [Cyanobacteria bacterium J06638_22]
MMTNLPQNLDEAIAQACNATHAALEDGLTRLQVELAFPELKIMPLAQQFVSSFADLGRELRIFFPDAGSAALARRDWGDVPYSMRGIGELKAAIQPEEKLFIFIEPSSVEVQQVEALCDEAGERPVIFLNPRLEDVATIGIGYAGRQLRDRFLNKLESCYYLRPIEGAALLRNYPAAWQVWFEQEGAYKLIADQPQKPVGDALDEILMRAQGKEPTAAAPRPARRGLLSGLQGFIRALNQ